MEPYIKKSAIVAEIEKTEKYAKHRVNEAVDKYWQIHFDGWVTACRSIMSFLDALEVKEVEVPVSKDLEEAAHLYIDTTIECFDSEGNSCCYPAFIAGALWQMKHLWKPADGDDLPEIDKEVIVLLSNGTVVYAHRPQEYWDGKNIATGEVTRHYPVRHDKGGWNIPDVKFWLDCELPKMEE